jgi:hypothetical protein
MRRTVMIAAGVLLLIEGVAIGAVNWVLGIVVDRQDMSLGGSDPGVTSVGAWTAGAVLVLFLAVVAVLLLVAGVRNRPLGRIARILVIVCAVFDAVVGIIAAGVIGWAIFAFTMIELGLLVLSLLMIDEEQDKGGTTLDGAPASPSSEPKPA